ncbi:UNVERIFIED_CONTAM: hypothetical protein GTU68_015748 [Idotea baltica]|nr:hypothetical protein [Idotea baltica]
MVGRFLPNKLMLTASK